MENTSEEKKIDVLAGKGWLAHVPEGFRQAVLRRTTLRTFRPAQLIYDVGDTPDGLVGLVSGQVQVLLGRGARMHAIAHIAQPGDWFGGYAVLAGAGRTVGLQAKSETEIAHLPQRAVDEMVAEDPQSWRWIGMLPAVNISAALMAVEDLMIRDPQKRCIAVLLRLTKCRNTGSDPAVAWVNQSELATMCNTSRSTIAALLSQLEEEGSLERGYGRIRMVQPDRVRRLLTE